MESAVVVNPLEAFANDFIPKPDDYQNEGIQDYVESVWKLFVKQQHTDCKFFIAPSAADIPSTVVKCHKMVVWAAMPSMRRVFAELATDQEEGHAVVELENTDPKSFVHLLAYSYTDDRATLDPGFVHLPGYPRDKYLNHYRNKGRHSPGEAPRSAGAEEVLFPIKLEALAKKLGMKGEVEIPGDIFGDCCCPASRTETGAPTYQCQLLFQNYDSEILCQYAEIVYTDFKPSDLARLALTTSAVCYLTQSKDCPGKYRETFEKVPALLKEVVKRLGQCLQKSYPGLESCDGHPILRVEETDPKLVLHALEFAYCARVDFLYPGCVEVEGLHDAENWSSHHPMDCHSSPKSVHHLAAKDEILFLARLAVLAGKIGMSILANRAWAITKEGCGCQDKRKPRTYTTDISGTAAVHYSPPPCPFADIANYDAQLLCEYAEITMWTAFLDQVLTDCEIVMYPPGCGNQFSIKSHKLVLWQIPYFRSILKHPRSIAAATHRENHLLLKLDIEPRYFLHILAHVYTTSREVLMPNFVGAVGEDFFPATGITHFVEYGQHKPEDQTRPATREELLFSAKITAAALKFGVKSAAMRQDEIAEQCSCEYPERSTADPCPLWVTTWDSGTIADYLAIMCEGEGDDVLELIDFPIPRMTMEGGYICSGNFAEALERVPKFKKAVMKQLVAFVKACYPEIKIP
ncbi:hypothetical protein Dda_0072 [Drechslerella dactyloides]|uniref:BTB domain-containing protein n=1 Tax=Drechslerella dactyloides TaxID=74499 RepID=A0AAD6NN40_DREDA|nr:hypothetical protein Dda_0072 [Drechslerella dactyloides]